MALPFWLIAGGRTRRRSLKMVIAAPAGGSADPPGGGNPPKAAAAIVATLSTTPTACQTPAMTDPIDIWLAHCPNPETDPIQGMREAGLLAPVGDYASLATIKAAIVQRTGLLGVGSVWGGRQLVFRHFLSFGTDAQRAEWGGRALSVAISEPNVGAHPKRLT